MATPHGDGRGRARAGTQGADRLLSRCEKQPQEGCFIFLSLLVLPTQNRLRCAVSGRLWAVHMSSQAEGSRGLLTGALEGSAYVYYK